MRKLIALFLLAAALPAAAQMYRWTDSAGKTHFSDTPPPPGAKNVERLSGTAPSGGDAESAQQQPFALRQAMQDNPVTLYTSENCEACGEARKLLNSRGIPFKEIFVASEAQLNELKQAVGSNSVPAMIVGASIVKGFETGQYNSALDAAGYPRAGILPQRTQTEPAPGAKPEAAPEPPPVRRGPYAPR